MLPILASETVSMNWRTVFLVLGVVQLLLAAAGVPSWGRWSFFPGGVLFVSLAQFVSVG